MRRSEIMKGLYGKYKIEKADGSPGRVANYLEATK
jgi:hypothetical protein